MVMLYRASSLPMLAALRSIPFPLSCNVLTFYVHIFMVSFRPQYWMTSPPRFADKSDWGQHFLGNLLYSLLRSEKAVLPLNWAALTSWQDAYGTVTPISITILPSHQGSRLLCDALPHLCLTAFRAAVSDISHIAPPLRRILQTQMGRRPLLATRIHLVATPYIVQPVSRDCWPEGGRCGVRATIGSAVAQR